MGVNQMFFNRLPAVAAVCVCLLGFPAPGAAEEKEDGSCWRSEAVEYTRVMSEVKWTPAAEGMPVRGRGYFEKGTEYTGVPYSSVRHAGRYIGFDIFLKTFLAAVENPLSVLYTEDLSGRVSNAAAYYGKVCSSLTSYAFRCGIWYVSRLHGPPHREGVIPVEPQSAQAARPGDFIYRPAPNQHVEIVTELTFDGDGRVTHVRVDDSYPPTTRRMNLSASAFEARISSAGRKLYRITDLDAWRGANRAESFLFPNYAEDSAEPEINRVLLLDRGDWVPYFKGQSVKINVMDRDSRGVERLIIRRGEDTVEDIGLNGPGVIERSFSVCGDYTAYCVMEDGSYSPACEFAVCELDFSIKADKVYPDEPWEIEFSSCNMDVIIVYLWSETNPYGRYEVFVSEDDRERGGVTIPAGLVRDAGGLQVWLIGENRYGRLKKRRDITVLEPAPR